VVGGPSDTIIINDNSNSATYRAEHWLTMYMIKNENNEN